VAKEKPVSHGLGFGSGSIIEHSNGVVEYRQTGKLLPAFRVNIADVTGFATRKPTKQDKKNGAGAFTVMIVLYGGGTELGAAAVNHGTPEKIEAWFRAHSLFRGNVPQAQQQAAPQPSLGDEIAQLAALHAQGVLTDEEFQAAKAAKLGTVGQTAAPPPPPPPPGSQGMAPGWYPDPEDRKRLRYFDGRAWTEHEAD
jgi:uncharacterized protein DUF2510/putative oligomerization/nucleic acid binding protein